MSALESSTSALKLARVNLEVAAHNIANAETPHYSKISVVQRSVINTGGLQGAEIATIRTETDEFLESDLLREISTESYYETKKYYLEQINFSFGKPNDDKNKNRIDTKITEIFTNISALATRPNNVTEKTNTVQAFVDTAKKISELALKLENLRLDANHKLQLKSIELNNELKNIHVLNKELISHLKGSIEYIGTESKIRESLQKLSSFFQIKQYKNSDGYMQIYTPNGQSLINTDVVYQTRYEPISSIEEIIDDGVFKPFYLTALDRDQQDNNLNIELITGGKSSQIQYGSIAALLDIRDKDIPNILDQLDILAKKLKDQFNILHNSNNGFPPPPELTSTHLMKRNDPLNFSGKFRISILNENGQPIINQHQDLYRGLVIDLEKLNTDPKGPNLQDFINEINYHFGEKSTVQNRAEIDNICDIKLAAVSSSVAADSPLILDLELSNFSGNNATLKILNATATDSDGNNIISTFNNINFDLETGNTLRTGITGPSITINNRSIIKYPYTVTIEAEVTRKDKDNLNPNRARITYLIDNPISDPFNGIKNQRFSPSSIEGSGKIDSLHLTAPLVTADLIDENSNSIANDNSVTAGRLRLKTGNNSYRIAIDQLDSSHVGDMSKNIFPTGLSLSSYLGLNDLFVRDDNPSKWGNLKNTAIFLGVRKDIKLDPNNLATAKLRELSTQTYAYEVTSGDSEAITQYNELAEKTHSFPPIGGLARLQGSFSEYANSIITHNSLQTKIVSNEYEKTKSDIEALKDNLDSRKGVDINTELIRLGLYQKMYGASGRIIQLLKEFDEVILSSF